MRGWGLAAVAAAFFCLIAPTAVGATLGQLSQYSTPTMFSGPAGLVAGPDGNVWFTEFYGDKVGEIDPLTGAMSEYQLPPNSAPRGITVAPDGNIWFTEIFSGEIGELNVVTHSISQFSIPSANSQPLGIVAAPSGSVWFTENGTGKIGELNPVTGAVSEFSAPAAAQAAAEGVSVPDELTIGPDGNIWFTEQALSQIGELNPTDPQAGITEIPTPTAASQPLGITSGPDGLVYFTEHAANKVGVLNPSTHAITEIPLPATASGPISITTGPDGDLWITAASPAIVQLNPTTQLTATFPISEEPTDWGGLAVGADGNVWFAEGCACGSGMDGTPAGGVESAVGMIGTGVPAASSSAPVISGSPQVGSTLSCQPAGWATWDGIQPTLSTEPFDGYQWLRGGTIISGATSSSYVPTTADGGQALTCSVTASYPFPPTTAVATSQPVTIAVEPQATSEPTVEPSLQAELSSLSVTGTTTLATIACQGGAGQSCDGTLTLSVTSDGKPITVASHAYTVPAGTSATIALALNLPGLRLLDSTYVLRARLSASGTDSLSGTVIIKYGRVRVKPTIRWKYAAASTVLRTLQLRGVPPMATVELICHGIGCPFTKHTEKAERGTLLTLTKTLAGDPLRPGATVEVKVTTADAVGAVIQWTIRSDKQPRQTRRCLPPKSSKPVMCPG